MLGQVESGLAPLTRFIGAKTSRYVAKIMNTPTMGDSITEGTVATWEKNVGDVVEVGDLIATIETDKITVDITSELSGVITKICVPADEICEVGEPLLEIDSDSSASTSSSSSATQETEKYSSNDGVTDKFGRHLTKVPMSRMRQTVAARLKMAQNNAASLTTFNEIDMSHLLAARKKYGAGFMDKNGVKLGLMSPFIKAATVALKEFPDINSHIAEDGKTIIKPEFIDISVAVASPSGLVVPVVRDCQEKNLADMESDVAMLASKARDGKITMEDMYGGSFTISNGGIFGSLMGTPILNPPQSAILGMHGTHERAVVRDGKVVARPMMYIALTYDHRIVDGREAVLFLKMIKELVEDPERLDLAQESS